MYVQDQPDFLNAVLEIRTKVAPHELLALLKQIEDTMGRHKTIDKGPRVMDLDILLYEHDIIKTPNLIVPHVGMADREFVLAPLADIAPDMQHPVLLRTPKQLLSHLMHQDNYTPSIERVFPVRDKLWRPKQRTFIMGILNVTPDSFSDGGQHMAHDEALRRAREMIQQGADMIDIGGQSTRPGAVDISAEQETARVVPIIQALRQQGFTAPISVDTFRADVARAALDAGADMINDVSGATRDPQMLPLLRTITSNRPAVCLMHMRGDSATMQSMAHYTHVVPEVAQELADRVHNVLQVGVPRWRVWIDPGIGFAKHTQHNMELLRNLQGLYEWYPQTLRQSSHPPLHGYPMLVGPSRKAFLGTLTKRHVPNERVMGSVAACIVAVNSGANMVRVHDVQQVKEALLVVDQVWKQ
jgi:dihydroneopterin aldolase/2-amino-4-hydroxy-6-hydroxymethyldihydropteridine diphosphokinase/dihydropteroate synthase/2-amino-4-hydroxy-6-hydroxymethyldihydropteridine diphosphokinase/dihydropteroate synthase